MAIENSKYDTIAMSIYETHHRAHPEWPAFFNMKRKERDYWRGLGEIAQKNNLWNPPDDVDILTT